MEKKITWKSLFISLLFIPVLGGAVENNLQKRVDSQALELQQLKNQIEKLNSLSINNSDDVAIPNSTRNMTFGGYGEIVYNSYEEDSWRNQMDLKRFVLFFGYKFSEDWSLISEVEWEHAITSADDVGETTLEQAYLNYKISENVNFKAGLFLMPFGFINLIHEAPVFYGVERNEVETRIIPSTWREGGVGFWGRTDSGWDWDVGLTSSFNLANYESTSAPLKSMRQKLGKAKAQDLALYGSVSYRIPSLILGSSLFIGNSNHSNAAFEANPDPALQPNFADLNGRVSLWDVRARWQNRGWDVQALYARGAFSEADEINKILQDFNTLNSTNKPYLPEEFNGGYLQVAYKFNLKGDASLAPFVRVENIDTQSKMPKGFAKSGTNEDQIKTVGVSFKPRNDISFKMDVQKYEENEKSNRFNLGMGYMF